MKKNNAIINWLQKENYKRFYLAVMRVCLSIFLLKEILFKWPVWRLLYSNTSALQFNTHSAFRVFGFGDGFLKTNYLLLIYVYIILLILFLFGIGKRLTAILLFILLITLQKLNNTEINGGDIMAKFLLFYLIFANSFQYFSFQKSRLPTNINNVISNLAAYSIMLQLCVAYLLTFYNKITNDYWFNGSAIYYIFNTKAFIGTSFNQTLSQQTWFIYFATYFTLLIEFCFPIFIWFKKTRKPIMIAGLLLHLGIYFFMMIYNLQVVFVLIYGLFFTTDEWLNFCNKRLKFLLPFIK